jgi:hypothetical protein
MHPKTGRAERGYGHESTLVEIGGQAQQGRRPCPALCTWHPPNGSARADGTPAEGSEIRLNADQITGKQVNGVAQRGPVARFGGIWRNMANPRMIREQSGMFRAIIRDTGTIPPET